MKILKALCVLFSLTIFFPVPARTAAAETTVKYAMALTDDVYIYDEMKQNCELFALPETYCVEIVKEYDGWYRVAYAEDDGFYRKVTGYCKKDNLQVLEEPPPNPYLNYPVEIKLTSGENPVFGLPGLEITVTAAFYGNYRRANTSYVYLRYDGGFGYVEGEINDYVKNEIPSVPTFSEGNAQNTGETSAVLPALIIGGLAVVAVAVLIVTGKKNYKKQ